MSDDEEYSEEWTEAQHRKLMRVLSWIMWLALLVAFISVSTYCLELIAWLTPG